MTPVLKAAFAGRSCFRRHPITGLSQGACSAGRSFDGTLAHVLTGAGCRSMQSKCSLSVQDGAQDEALAHRSFTGGTGARMQYFLNYIGITESYLF